MEMTVDEAELAEADDASSLKATLEEAAQASPAQRGPWVYRLAMAYLLHREAHPPRSERVGTPIALAQVAVRRAAMKTSLSGAASGLLTTGATLVSAELGVLGAVVGVPAAVLGVGGEMLYRLMLHLELTCEIAEIYGVKFDPKEPSDFWAALGLAFGTHKPEEGDPGKELVDKVMEAEVHDVGEEIGSHLLGESAVRNLVPFLGVATSSITNWRVTHRLGKTLESYVRYRRAIHDALAQDDRMVEEHLPLIVEGMWFLFSADGKLSHEEAGLLARHLGKLDEATKKAVQARFTTDETEWLTRLEQSPAELKGKLLHLLLVAAAVDRRVPLPEQKILTKAAKALGADLDAERVHKLIREFDQRGVIEVHLGK
jgi:hypothetical protein